MPTCPNCGYELVLLSYRLKYKCALCSRLYLQQEVENRNFRIWNEKMRENDLHNLKLEENQRIRDINERRILRAFKLLFKEKGVKLNPEEMKQRKREYDMKYYSEHKEEKILQKKLWRQNNKEYYSKWKKLNRLQYIDKKRQQDRLALQCLENGQYEASNSNILSSVSTMSLSHLLFSLSSNPTLK